VCSVAPAKGKVLIRKYRLYTSGTPNGQKISITLEELGIKYETTHVDISKSTQKEDWYLKINRRFSPFIPILESPDAMSAANGRIPAIIDRTPSPEGKSREKRVFEGQAIMLYLCQKYDEDSKISFPFDTEKCVVFPPSLAMPGQSLTRDRDLGTGKSWNG
jgi:glutathione S-transferase